MHVGSTLSAATLTVHRVLLSSASALTRGIMIHAQACISTVHSLSIVHKYFSQMLLHYIHYLTFYTFHLLHKICYITFVLLHLCNYITVVTVNLLHYIRYITFVTFHLLYYIGIIILHSFHYIHCITMYEFRLIQLLIGDSIKKSKYKNLLFQPKITMHREIASPHLPSPPPNRGGIR